MLRQHKRFDDYYDDSSDEEEIDEKISEYNIQAEWKKFKKRDVSSDNFFSFVAHAAGIKLLYSKNVNKLYYPLKRFHLREKSGLVSPVSILHGLIKKALLDSFSYAEESAKQFLMNSGQKKNTTAVKNFKKIQAEFITEIDRIIDSELDIFIGWLHELKSCEPSLDEDAMIHFDNRVIELFKKLFNKYFSTEEDKSDRNETLRDLLELANEKLTEILNELNFDTKQDTQGKEEALEALRAYEGQYKNLVKKISRILEECPARGKVDNMIIKVVSSHKREAHEIMQAFLADLVSLKNFKSKKKLISDKEKTMLDTYYSFSHQALLNNFIIGFSFLLQDNLSKAIGSFYRPVLGKAHLFTSNNPYAFFANLRLSNRSQKRQIANLQSDHDAIFTSDSVSRTWRLLPLSSGDTDTNETQNILNSFGRRDIIEGLGNYEKVNEAINDIRTYCHVDGKTIAQWLRSVLQGTLPQFNFSRIDQITIAQKLQSVTYLLFGCEATRNPAMHVINHMLLDLIIAEEWSFNYAFNGKKMPMAPEGAVAVARALTRNYRAYMPYSYSYRGIEEGRDCQFETKDLRKLEADVVKDWLKLKTGSAKCRDPEWLLTTIESCFTEWLGALPVEREEKEEPRLEVSMSKMNLK